MGKYLALFALCVLPLGAAEEFLTGTPAIRYSLAKLNVLGSVLMIGAHPDDENNARARLLSRGLKAAHRLSFLHARRRRPEPARSGAGRAARRAAHAGTSGRAAG